MSNPEACPSRTFVDADPEVYINPRRISFVRKISPRFGNSDNITEVIASTPANFDQQDLRGNASAEEYLTGVVASALVIFGFFFLWMMVLLVFKWCLGYKRVGFLSGHRVVRPKKLPRQTDPVGSHAGEEKVYQEVEEEWHAEAVFIQERRLRRIRITTLLAGTGILLCVGIMLGKGVASLSGSLDSTHNGLLDGRRLALDAISLIDDFDAAQERISVQADAFTSQINGFCPTIRAEICTTEQVQDPTGGLIEERVCDYTDIPYGEFLEPIESLDVNVIVDDLVGGRSDLIELADNLEDYAEIADSVEWPFKMAIVFGVLMAIVDVLIMSSVVVAWRRDQYATPDGGYMSCFLCCQKWIVAPAFLLLVFLCWLFTMVFFVGSVTTADFCYDSPDEKALAFLRENRDDFGGSIIYDYLLFFVDRCSSEDMPTELTDKIDYALSSSGELVNFLTQVTGDVASVQAICGADPSPFTEASSDALRELCTLTGTLYDVQEYFTCQNWHPLYATVAYDAICYESSQGFWWLSSSLFWIVLFAMVMLTLRTGFYQIEELDGDGKFSWEEESESKQDYITDHELTLRDDTDSPTAEAK